MGELINKPLMTAEEASVRLSKLIERELGKVLTPLQLRIFLREHWGKVGFLGHIIHNGRTRV